MTEPVLLISGNSRLRLKLESEPFQLATWPAPQLQTPDRFAALDEVIGNLYGYDWIVFVTADSVRLFLERLESQKHDVSELDSLRVCSIGEATNEALERAQVHVDVIAKQLNAASIVEELKSFAGSDELDRSNFLIPQAAIGKDYLKQHIEDTGARVDVLAAYQTVSAEDLTRLSGLQSMLRTGSVDAVLFASAGEVHEFALVFDTNDIGPLVKGTTVLTIDEDTSNTASAFGASRPIQVSEPFGVSIGEVLSQKRRR